MSKRLTLTLIITFGMVLVGIGLSQTYAQDDGHGGDNGAEERAILRGAVNYAEYCGACHGPEGESIAEGAAFPDITDYNPRFAKGQITQGYDSDPTDRIMMFGYGEDYDGPLSDEEIDDILAYMGTWGTGETPALPAPNLQPGEVEVIDPGDPARGAEIYATTCLGCHGRDAQGRELDNFPAFTIDENTMRIVERGEGHEPVAAFGQSFGGPLSETDLQDLDAYLKSIEAEVEEEGPQGVSILLIIMGLGAIGVVGAVYFANQRRVENNEEST